MGTRAEIVAHEYVAGAFEAVLDALQTSSMLSGAGGAGSRDRSLFARRGSRGTASRAVQIGDAEATLLVVRVIGGRQEPVTELLLTRAVAGDTQLPESEARRFLEDVVLTVEKRLTAASRARPVRAGAPAAWRSRPHVLVESRDIGAGQAVESRSAQGG